MSQGDSPAVVFAIGPALVTHRRIRMEDDVELPVFGCERHRLVRSKEGRDEELPSPRA